MHKTFSLNNGMKIPAIGLGTYKSAQGEVENAVKIAIDAGYRHFDCAWFYGNESEVGAALKEKIASGAVTRSELFITSKLWNNFHERDRVVPMLKETLLHLQLDYVDLYLVHWPFGFRESAPCWPTDEGAAAFSDVDYVDTWRGMEECVDLGLARSVGVSNFSVPQLERVLAAARVRPVCNQVEVNPNLSQRKLTAFCRAQDVVVVGYCPLGRSELAGTAGFPEPTIFDPKVAAIGAKFGKTAAQVVLNYLVNVLGVCVIPKSVTKSRIVENINIFDFNLDEEDVKYLDSCNKNQRVCTLTDFSTHKYYSFHETE